MREDDGAAVTTAKLILGDCLDEMRGLPDGSIDMVLCDPPYGTTANKWDAVIDLSTMWKEIWRVCRRDAAVTLMAAQPFTSTLINSCRSHFKYNWVWEKNRPTNFLNAKHQPLRCLEDVCVFYRKRCTYNPQGVRPFGKMVKQGGPTENYGDTKRQIHLQEVTGYPRQILRFSVATDRGMHPTQKPVSLMEYMIKTYTLPGETVLDFTMGSGTTGVACMNTGRAFVGIEKDPKYFQIAEERIRKTKCSPQKRCRKKKTGSASVQVAKEAIETKN